MSGKQKSSYNKEKTSQKLGFRTSDFFKGKTFGGGKQPTGAGSVKFNPAQFKTQHKG